MTLEEFKKKNKPKSDSKLNDFKDEIKNLIENKYSQTSICQFLKSKNVITKQSNLSQFIKRHFKELVQKTKDEAVAIVEEVEPRIQTQTPQKSTTGTSSLFKKSEVKSYEIVEPDYSKFHH